jgi:aminopeptidase N
MKKILFSLLIFSLLPSIMLAQTKADTIHISHYDINLEIRDFDQKVINGYTEVKIEAKIAPLDSIFLHFMTLTVDSVKNGNNHIPFGHQGMQLKIEQPFLSVGQPETIRVYYQGTPHKEGWGGFIFDGGFAYNIGVAFYEYPHSFGRVWYPCIDEFTDKSTYTFNIITDADKKAICGGMLIDSVTVSDGVRWTWELTDPIPTYLASVAVGKFQAYKDTILSVNGKVLPIEIYADSTTVEKVPGSFANLKSFIHTFEKRWGPCQWQRVGYVAVPFFQGSAMEHATNIAYPIKSISGNISNQDLISHELAHSWFGNLITCSSSNNMWINEGFARYGEYLCHEILDPTLQKYKTGIKSLHFRVLKSDNGQYALDNLPTSQTYNSTIVYDKGGLVAFTLRNYMGDDLHFSSIKQLLNENKYGNISSEEFFEKLSNISKMDLYDFYLGWVHQPGFLNFNIDSVKPDILRNNTYKVAFKQKLYRAEYFANNNRVDVEFVSVTGERKLVEKMKFSGEHEIVEVELPFEPVFWAIDPNDKMADACFKYTQRLNKEGSTYMADGCLRIQVDEITDEAIIRVEHNPVAPTPPPKNQPNIFRISEKHFWRIGFLQSCEMQAKYLFTYNTKTYDADLLQGFSYNELVLLYRKDASYDWQVIPVTVSGNSETGTLQLNHILPGEYTFGFGEEVGINEWENKIEVYPNPTTGELRVKSLDLRVDEIEIFDVLGKKRKTESRRQKTDKDFLLDISSLQAGTYFIKIKTDKGTVSKKIIKNL